MSALTMRSRGGAFAIAWLDTINDERDSLRCLGGQGCTTVGEATSLDYLHHAVAWLDVRTLARLSGVSIDALLWMGHIGAALAVTIAATVACRGGGRIGAACAAVLAGLALPSVVNPGAVCNTMALPFLGAVLLVVLVEAATTPTMFATVLSALLAACLVNVHCGCAPAGLSVLWVALLVPRGRWKRGAVSIVVFATSSFAMAPGSWATNAVALAQRALGPHSSLSSVSTRVDGSSRTFCVALFVVGVTIATVLHRRKRPDVQASAALALPMFAAAVVAQLTSFGAVDGKYFAYVLTAGAVLLAAPIEVLVSGVGATRLRLVRKYAPYAAALAIGRPFDVEARIAGGRGVTPLTFHELTTLPAELEERGWSLAHVYRSLKSPDEATLLSAFELLAPSYPLGPSGDDPTNVYVLKVRTRALPAPLHAGWKVISSTGSESVVMIFTPTALDWSHFEVCSGDRGHCVPGGLGLDEASRPVCASCVEGMPRGGEPTKLELRFALRPATDATPWAVSMPRALNVCAGTVRGVDPGEVESGSRATWSSRSQGVLGLGWDVGSAGCPRWAYTGVPPFFLEGDAATVKDLESLGL